MSVLDAWRREVRALIPRGFLRRAQGEGLFVSDYPRFPGAEKGTESLLAAGFRVKMDGSIARIDVCEDKARAFLRGLPLTDVPPTDETLPIWALAQRLVRADGPVTDPSLDWLTGLLKRLDEGRVNEAAAELAARAAVCQRRHAPLPGAAGRLLLLALSERKGDEKTC